MNIEIEFYFDETAFFQIETENGFHTDKMSYKTVMKCLESWDGYWKLQSWDGSSWIDLCSSDEVFLDVENG